MDIYVPDFLIKNIRFHAKLVSSILYWGFLFVLTLLLLEISFVILYSTMWISKETSNPAHHETSDRLNYTHLII